MGWIQVSRTKHHYLLRGDSEEGNDELEAAFIQAWLYFGLLVEILRTYDVALRLSDFLRLGQSRLFVSTTLLPDYSEQMAANDQSFSLEDRRSRMAVALAIFEDAANYAKCLVSADDLHALCCSPDVALSILILGATLQGPSSLCPATFSGYLKTRISLKDRAEPW